MTDPSENDSVGYRRPPKRTRWKTGQSGNPRSTKAMPKLAESSLAVIERLLFEPVRVMKNGEPAKMSAAAAIINQLMQKSFSGDRKATRVLQKYEEFANRNSVAQFQIVFVETDYSLALSATRNNDNV